MTDDFEPVPANITAYFRCGVWLVSAFTISTLCGFHTQQALQPCLIKFALSSLVYCFYYVESVVNITSRI